MSDKERRAYDEHMDDIMVQNDVLDTAEEKGVIKGIKIGREEGRAKGRAEGRAEGIMLTAKNLKSMGFSIADITKATGLSEEDIMKI